VDIDKAAATEAAGRFPNSDARALPLDLTQEESLASLHASLAPLDDGLCVTCFELIEHLETFVPLVRFLTECADGGATVLLSVPNDAFSYVVNPFHRSAWGEGAFAELRELLPTSHVTLEQVAVTGSLLTLRDAPRQTISVEIEVEERANVPTHLLAAFGSRATEIALTARASVLDNDSQRTWERQREIDLAYSTARLGGEVQPRSGPGPTVAP
jgi:hypothetical protein